MATSAAQKAAAQREKARAAKFVELAEKRTTKAINAVRSIAKLSNRNNYVFTEDQVNKIAEALRGEVVSMHESFSAPEAQVKEGFKL